MPGFCCAPLAEVVGKFSGRGGYPVRHRLLELTEELPEDIWTRLVSAFGRGAELLEAQHPGHFGALRKHTTLTYFDASQEWSRFIEEKGLVERPQLTALPQLRVALGLPAEYGSYHRGPIQNPAGRSPRKGAVA
jgi:hypothetical protein